MLAVGLSLAACGDKGDGEGEGTTGVNDGPLDWMENDAYGVPETDSEDDWNGWPADSSSTGDGTFDDTSTDGGSGTGATDTGATDTATAGTTETGDTTAATSGADTSAGESATEPTGTGTQDGG